MTVDPSVVPGLLLFALELLALAAAGYVVARVALRQADGRMALAQGVVIGPAAWGLAVNFLLFWIPGYAGAVTAWIAILIGTAVLIKRAPHVLSIKPRTIAGFSAVFLALFWVALAARQIMKIPDPPARLGLPSQIQAGGWPLSMPWNPDFRLYYHYGVDILTGLLAPPTGPNFVLVTELMSAFIWTGFALVVATMLLKRGGWICTLTLSPLLLTAGTWTLLGYANWVPNIVQIPVPTELATIGLRSSLASLYWPEITTPWHSEFDGAPGNIWKPVFILGYALALIILAYAAENRPRSPLSAAVLAVLAGFLGIVNAEVALLTIGLWILLEAVRLAPSLKRRDGAYTDFISAAAGPVVALLLLALGGGVLTGILAGEPRSGLSLGWIDDPFSRQIIGRYKPLQGRIGLLGIGAISVAVIASLLAFRDRLVLALAVGTVPTMIAALILRYEIAPLDVSRFDGHARNFALLALLLALAGRLSVFNPGWRLGISIIGVLLIVWPTIARPVRTIGLGVGRGVQLTNPQPGILDSDSDSSYHDLRRYVIETPVSPTVTRFIRQNTSVDTRVFSPHPSALSIATGRPNASGFIGHLHQEPTRGPEFLDVLHYLEPRAVRRIGFAYLHATRDWVEQLPEHAQRWLDDPRLFGPLVQTESDALYRIQAAFLQLDATYSPASFEALRQAIPAEATVLLAPGLRPKHSLAFAIGLSHARLVGTLDPVGSHLLTPLPRTVPFGAHEPYVVALPARMAPSAFAPGLRRPVWWNEDVAVYTPTGAVAPLTQALPAHFSVQLSDVQLTPERIRFTAAFTDRAADRWQGQDWVVVATDDSPWRLPYRFDTVDFNSVYVRWFDGQVQPVPDTEVHEYFFLYEFDPRTGTLAVWDGSGYAGSSPPHPQLPPGTWMLAARPNVNRDEVGLIPVLHFTVTEDGAVTSTVYEGSLDAMLVR